MDNQNQPLQSIPSDPAPINRDNNAQGFYRKTNWKFIAIVVAVGFIISGGLFLLISLNSKKTQSAIDVFNQSGQPLQNVILKQGNKTQVVIPKSTTQQNPNSILTHDNSPCAFESLAYDYYLDTYIVKKGDTLLSISKSQSGNTSRVSELIQLNQEKYPSLSIANPFIEIGWQLFLPPKFQKSSTGKLFGLKGRIVDQNQSAFQIGTSSSIPVGSMGILAFKKDTTKYFGKDKFEIGDCITIVFDDHSITLAISPQDKNYFKEAQEIDTSTWQTYRNNEFGFEVRYPNGWEIKNKRETQLHAIFGCPISEFESFVGKDGTSKTGFGVCLFRVGTDFRKEALKDAESSEFASRKEIILDGNTAIRQKLVDSDLPEISIYHVHINTTVKGSPGTLILVGFNGDAVYSDEKFESILDQILSTFRFTE